VLGSFGMGPATPVDQRKKVAEVVIKRTNHRIPSIVHVGAVDPYTSIELGKHARSIGAEAIGIVGPYYYSDRSEWEIIEQVKMVNHEVGLPILIYNNAAYSGYDIGPSMMAKLVQEVPQIFGSKLAAGNISQAQRYLRVIPDFSIFIPAQNLFPGMLVGIKGSITPPLATYPEIGASLVKAIDDRDWEKATTLQVKMLEYFNFRASLSAKYGRAVFTESMRLRGFNIQRYPRWPTKPFTSEDRENLRAALVKVGVPL
ncbi:MAG: dihydrodipicolinate synthase family protein, partial [Candidatus Binatia bacterium]